LAEHPFTVSAAVQGREIRDHLVRECALSRSAVPDGYPHTDHPRVEPRFARGIRKIEHSQATAPRSAVRMAPVIRLAAGLARKTTRFAISRGSPKHPSDVRLRWKLAAAPSDGFASVFTDPGCTRFTVMPFGPS